MFAQAAEPFLKFALTAKTPDAQLNLLSGWLAEHPDDAAALTSAFKEAFAKLPEHTRKALLKALAQTAPDNALHTLHDAVDSKPVDTFEGTTGTATLRTDPLETAKDITAARKKHGLPTSETADLAALKSATEQYATHPDDENAKKAWLGARAQAMTDLALWTDYAKSLGKQNKAYAGAKAHVEQLELKIGEQEATVPPLKENDVAGATERARGVPLSLEDASDYTSTEAILAAYRAGMASKPPRVVPPGISEHHYWLGVALAKQGITEADLTDFLNGKDTKHIADARGVAERTGEWTAANSMAALMELAASSVRAQRHMASMSQAADQRTLDGLSDGDPMREIVTARMSKRADLLGALKTTQDGLREAVHKTYREADAQRFIQAKNDILIGASHLDRARQEEMKAADATLQSWASALKAQFASGDDAVKLKKEADAKQKVALDAQKQAERAKKMGNAAIDRGTDFVLARAVDKQHQVEKLGAKAPDYLVVEAGDAWSYYAFGVSAGAPPTPQHPDPENPKPLPVSAVLGTEKERQDAIDNLKQGKGLDTGAPLPKPGEKPSALGALSYKARLPQSARESTGALQLDRSVLGKIIVEEKYNEDAADEAAAIPHRKAVDKVRQREREATNARDLQQKYLDRGLVEEGANNHDGFFATEDQVKEVDDKSVTRDEKVYAAALKLDEEAAKKGALKGPYAMRYWGFRSVQNSVDHQIAGNLLAKVGGKKEKLTGEDAKAFSGVQDEIGAYEKDAAQAHFTAAKSDTTKKKAGEALSKLQEELDKLNSDVKSIELDLAKAKADLAAAQAVASKNDEHASHGKMQGEVPHTDPAVAEASKRIEQAAAKLKDAKEKAGYAQRRKEAFEHYDETIKHGADHGTADNAITDTLEAREGIDRVEQQQHGNTVAAYVAKRWDPLESTCRHASLSIL